LFPFLFAFDHSRSHLVSLVPEIKVKRMARGTFGERLKRERELREVSIDELMKATRISQRFLEALENEDWAKLPGGVFGRAFVRTIARYLGLDEESFLAEYDAARGSISANGSSDKPEERIPSPPKWLPVAAVVVLLAVLAGLVFAGRYAWRRYAAHRAQQKSSASIAPQVNESSATDLSPTAPRAAAVPAAFDLAVSTSAATRMRIVSDGTVVLDAAVPAGETRHFAAKDHFEVTAADSSAVLLELNGQAMPPLGAPGTSGTIVLSQQDLRQTSGGNPQP
jgi:cytoskeleton protein RodZ